MKALVVDNEELTRLVLAGLLIGAGWMVQAATGGKEALQAFEAGRFDVAIIDVDLGEGPDGIAVARQLRSLEPELRVILVSGDILNETRVREAGLENFLLKPFETQALLSRVASPQARPA